MNNVTNLSEHFTLAELTKTNTRIDKEPEKTVRMVGDAALRVEQALW